MAMSRKRLGLSDSPQHFFSVAKKTALVTDASSGLGRTIAARLFQQGCSVVVAAQSMEKLEELCQQLIRLQETGEVREQTEQKGDMASRCPPWKSKVHKAEARCVQLDLSAGQEAMEEAVQEAWEALGGLDIIVSCASTSELVGSLGSGACTSSTLERTEEWDSVLNTNLRGTGLVIAAVGKRMVAARRPGSIINISSIAGMGRGVAAGGGIYSASNAGVMQLSKALALELGPHHIRVNSIAPGMFESENGHLFAGEDEQSASKKFPLHRTGRADPDITSVVLLLASDTGAYITGTTIIVDGGVSLKSISSSD